jgi:hypothetical protein
MSILGYAFMNSNNEIINVCAVGEGDNEMVDILKNHHEASYTLLLEEVGYPTHSTDIWDPENTKWIVTEIPTEVPLVFVNEENPYGQPPDVEL